MGHQSYVIPYDTEEQLQAILDTIREDGVGFANIGKLRFMKSGKIVLRLQLPDSADFADLEINKGIDATFY